MILSDETVELILDAIDNEIDSLDNLNHMLDNDEIRRRDNLMDIYCKLRCYHVVLVSPQKGEIKEPPEKPEVDLMISNPDFLEITG